MSVAELGPHNSQTLQSEKYKLAVLQTVSFMLSQETSCLFNISSLFEIESLIITDQVKLEIFAVMINSSGL